MATKLGPAGLVMAAAVARRHYLAGESKVEIAAALGISRFKVARILEDARANGLVRIEIPQQGPIDADLSAQLQERYGLRHCAVVVTHGTSSARSALGAVAAELLSEIVTEQDVLGLPWARSIADMINAVSALPRIPIVQMSGALVVPGETTSPVDLVRRAARLSGGESHLFYAPMLLDDTASTIALRRQPSVATALEEIPRVTVAVVGVGAWRPGSSTIHEVCSGEDRREVAESGAIGEVAGVFYDKHGAVVSTVLSERLVTVTAAQLRAIPEVIGIAYGRDRARAVRAGVRGGLIDALVVDDAIARWMLRR